MPVETNANQKERPDFIVCPQCSGLGQVSQKICPTCGGLGLGAFHEGAFLYWGTPLSGAENRYRRGRRVFFRFINMAALLFGAFSLAVFCYRLIFVRGLQLEPFWPWFFGMDSARFWLAFGALALMFAYYRLRTEAAELKKIAIRAYDDQTRPVKLPNNWAELKKAFSLQINVGDYFSPEALRLVEEAYTLALTGGQPEILPLHLFLAALANRQVAAFFSRLSVDGAALIEKLRKQLLKLPTESTPEPRLGTDLQEVLISAYAQSSFLHQRRVEPVHFLIPLLATDNILREILYDLNVDLDKARNVTAWFAINNQLLANYQLYKRAVKYKPATTMDRAYTAMATPLLNTVGTDLTIAAKWGKLEFTVGREQVLENIFRALDANKSGILLVGPEGVGKTAVLYALAQRMAAEDVSRLLRDKRLVEIDISLLLGGVGPAQAEQRLLEIIREVQRAGNVILVVENLENIMGISTGGEESLDLSEVLANAIKKFSIICLATVSEVNYRKYLEGKFVAETMAKVEVTRPDKNDTIRVIESKVGAWEGQYNAYLTYNAIAAAVDLSEKYIHDRQLPEKALDILQQAVVRVAKEKGGQSLVTEEDVAAVISEITKIPSAKISDRESETLLHLEEKIHERMINQEEAVSAVVAALRRARAQMQEGKRPIANFLFLGPTGVGKTELAKTVAAVYFGNEKNMIRVDMSEYQEADSVKKMIGDPSGIAGYLTEAVRRQPFALILLDEFEKAHPDILNLFLQVMDDGRLTDGSGRTIDFTNSIVIATSNIGANFIQEQVLKGRSLSALKDELLNEHLPRALRPELINRFDGVILFEPLSMTHVLAITKLMMKKIADLLEKKGVILVCEEDGLRALAAKGYDPQFGARPLRRLLQDTIEAQIANLVIAGGLKRRDTVIIDSQAQVQVEKAAPL